MTTYNNTADEWCWERNFGTISLSKLPPFLSINRNGVTILPAKLARTARNS
jgi:hypothetical protein